MAKKVRQLMAEGKDIVGLTLGEPDFDTPDHIREAAIQAIRDGHTHYPPVAGIPELREAIAAKFRNEYGLATTASQVVVSTGAKQALVNVIMSLVNPGEGALVVAPYWVSYREMLKMADAEIKVVQTTVEEEYKLSPEKLDAALDADTKLLILNNPSNPTGSAYSQAELAGLVEVLERYPNLIILSDEIYEYITYEMDHTCLAGFESIRDRVIVVNGMSKGFAMTGWRIGYSVSTPAIAQLCEKYQGQITSGANIIAQYASLAGLISSLEPTFAMRDSFRERRDYMFGALSEMDGVKVFLPPGAFYFYPDVSGYFGRVAPSGKRIEGIQDLCDYLLDEGGVAVITGEAFGTDSHVRISYAYSMDMLQNAMGRMQQSLALLK